jgi:hypothetical protein
MREKRFGSTIDAPIVIAILPKVENPAAPTVRVCDKKTCTFQEHRQGVCGKRGETITVTGINVPIQNVCYGHKREIRDILKMIARQDVVRIVSKSPIVETDVVYGEGYDIYLANV